MPTEPGSFAIDIRTVRGTWRCPEAFATGVAGLVVHRVVIEGEDEKPKLGTRWVVTHEGSGQTVVPGSLESKDEAVKFARAIAPVAAWEVKSDLLESVPGLLDKIHTIARRLAPVQRVDRGRA